MITKETKKEEPDFDKEETHQEIRREVSMEISMEGIVKWFPPDHRALNGLNLNISPGETVQILGYAGSGKSLLADILTGRTLPEEGRVCFRGQDYARMKPEERAHLRWKYMVLLRAHPGFLPALSMRENTALPLLLSGERRRAALSRAQEAMEAFGVEIAARRTPEELTPAELCRCQLARASLREPELILADSFPVGLNEREEIQIRQLLQVLQMQMNATLVLLGDHRDHVCHADRTLFLRSGRLWEEHGQEENAYEPNP